MPLPPGYERLQAIRHEREKVEPMFASVILPILLPILLRYAVAGIGAGAAGAAAYAMQHWGVSTGTVAGVGGGVVAFAAAVITAATKNSSAAAIINRIPVADMLHAVADSTHADVRGIQVGSAALADSVPSTKVTSPEGQSQPQV